MKMVSRIALAAVLAVGVNDMAFVAPAVAKDKKDAAPTTPPLSKEVRAAAIAAEASLNATPPDLATAETHVAEIEAAAKTDYERYIAQARRLVVENRKNLAKPEAERSQAVLAAPLDALIANPATPKEELGIRLNERANVAYQMKQYPAAAQFFARARDAGYTNQDLLLNIARSKVEGGDVVGGMADLDTAVAAERKAGRKPPEAWFKYAISRLYKINNSERVEYWTRNWLSEYGTPSNWRDAIYSFGFSGPNVAKYSKNRIDLYRLLYATKSFAGQKEYIDYADAAITIGVPQEAKSILDEGFANGAIPKGNPTAVDFAKQAASGVAGSSSAAMREKAAVAGSDPDLARQAGDAYLGARNYAKAVEMYRLAETKKYTDLDRINLHIGIALAMSGDRDGAKLALAKVTSDPSRAIARLWLTYAETPPVS